MLDKLEEIKRQTEASNERLRELVITETSQDNWVSVTMNGHRELKEIKLSGDLSKIENEDLEDLIHVTFSKVIDRVNKANEAEVMSSAQSLFPGL